MRFESLAVWQRACRVTCEVYKAMALCKDYVLKNQITRSSLSVPSNIAEGEERETIKDMVRFYVIAKGSAGELVTQLYIGIKIGLIESSIGFSLIDEVKQITAMIVAIIKYKRSNISEI